MNRIVMKFGFFSAALLLMLTSCEMQHIARNDNSGSINVEKVKAGTFDNGKMWTFDFPPVDYFTKTYKFTPTKEWFDKARLSALRLPNCTASFVSEDGLVMSNHHCARAALDSVNREGERLAEVGFYASTLEEERRATNIFIDQLIVMEDVTTEVQQAFDSGTTDGTKVANRLAKIQEIQKRNLAKYKTSAPQDSMVFSVVSFYNGGRFSLYGYKRYTDVRLVYAPEEVMAFFGGDPDNFTYPRYDFDCSFFRVYENGAPLKTSNFFRFSQDGAKEGDAVFVIGNPGSTSRLQTIAQLEYLRDFVYPANIETYDKIGNIYSSFVAQHPDAKLRYINTIFGLENSRKALTGYATGLRDPYLMAKKRDFEKTFQEKVLTTPELKVKYGNPWKEIAKDQLDLNEIYQEQFALNIRGRNKSQYLILAADLVEMATALKMPRETVPSKFQGTHLDSTKAKIYPRRVVPEIERQILAFQFDVMKNGLAGKNEAFNTLLGDRSPDQAAADIASSTFLASKEKVKTLLAGTPDDILNSSDPLIHYVVQTQPRIAELQKKAASIREKQAANVQLLGKAMYEVYGTQIPPDATFTLRIADGIVKGYEYNGTIAPPMTTFYGLYDRYYSFGMKDPWKLSERWINPPATFKMSTPMNFVSTNDIIGGNSGSPVINKDLQVVGLIFDGNIESLPGDVIFDDTKNRSVSVYSAGILEGLEQIYKANRIAKELRAGKIVQ